MLKKKNVTLGYLVCLISGKILSAIEVYYIYFPKQTKHNETIPHNVPEIRKYPAKNQCTR